ncbi:MAG: hypothetical protein CM1200mP1_09790 [Candidatus Neomarinimicrobiota bacterium]|nr:MAG: hypothetical protein CM1200mP1_09790 [Candidatus Neomarinimicrobiota bacterium]
MGGSLYHSFESAYLDRKEQKSIEDADRLTSKDWAKKRASEIHNDQSSIDWNTFPGVL